MRGTALFLLAAGAALAACSAVEPFATAPLSAEPKAPADAGPRVAICYNPLRSDAAKTQSEAQAECAPATTAIPIDTDYYLQNCPLLLPARATFVCAPRK